MNQGLYSCYFSHRLRLGWRGWLGLALLLTMLAPPLAVWAVASFQFVTKWGTAGNGDGQFRRPSALVVNGVGVYVVDANNDRIQRFTSTGTFVSSWGSYGSGNGQFKHPSGIAFSGSNLYVVDLNNNRIQQFSSTGTFLTKWGTLGSGNGQFDFPTSVAVDSSGNVYVADANNSRIQKFNSTGTFLTKWGTFGVGDGQFIVPWGMAIDSNNYVYVADAINNRIQKFTSTGTFVTSWATESSGDGSSLYPYGIAVDNVGDIYVSDAYSHRIQKFTNTGTLIARWGIEGNGDGQFRYPSGIDVDFYGDIYVADTFNDRIQKFTFVDSTPPETALTGTPPNPSHSAAASFTFAGTDDVSLPPYVSFVCQLDGGGFTPCISPQTYTGLGNGSHTFEVQASDLANNSDPTPANYTWIVDKSLTVSINQASGQADPTDVSPLHFTVIFQRAVIGFTSSDVSFTGSSAAGPLSALVTGIGATYNVAVSGMTSTGTVVVSLAANVASDGGGNGNTASTSSDNSVSFLTGSLINGSVTQQAASASYNGTAQPCLITGGTWPIHTVTLTLRNTSAKAFSNLVFKVKTLAYTTAQSSPPPVLCNATSGAGGVGSQLTLANSTLPGGDKFDPGEDFLPTFHIGLSVRAPYRFFVELYAASATAAADGAAQDGEYLGSFVLTLDATEHELAVAQLFLPLVAR